MIENVLIGLSLPEFSSWQKKKISNVYQMLLALLGHGLPQVEHETLHPSSKSDFYAVKPNCAPSDIGIHSDNFHEGKISF